jgi:hypothetical protein
MMAAANAPPLIECLAFRLPEGDPEEVGEDSTLLAVVDVEGEGTTEIVSIPGIGNKTC